MKKLSPQQRAFIRRRVKQKSEAPSGEMSGELNIVPFLDIVVNLIMFLLVTVTSVIAVTQVAAQLPSYDQRCRTGNCPDVDGLELTVTLTTEGTFVAGSGGVLPAGCNDAGPVVPGPTVAAGDSAALTTCLRRVKDRFPDEHVVTLGADPVVPYEDLVAAMDAARGDERGVLFPTVRIAAGVR